MSLEIGIVGLPNVGKSTLFQALTKKEVARANYPFCTIDPNIGVVEVIDERVDKLAEISQSKKKIYATVKFVDIAGLVHGAHKGEGLGNQFLAHIREVDAVVYVLRCFRNERVVNTQSKIDVLEEKGILDTEMALKDLETIGKRIQVLEKEAKSGKKEIIREMQVLKKAQDLLQKGRNLIESAWESDEKKVLRSYQFLTLKPRLYVLNGSEDDIPGSVLESFEKNHWPFIIIDILTELEAEDISPEERKDFGLPPKLKIDSLISAAYHLLGLITFFTTGKDETRAWTLEKGKTAPAAGGVIHSDFEKYFIRAEVINWKVLYEAGGFVKAREKGLVRTEGKDYIVQDGDVIEIKSSV